LRLRGRRSGPLVDRDVLWRGRERGPRLLRQSGSPVLGERAAREHQGGMQYGRHAHECVPRGYEPLLHGLCGSRDACVDELRDVLLRRPGCYAQRSRLCSGHLPHDCGLPVSPRRVRLVLLLSPPRSSVCRSAVCGSSECSCGGRGHLPRWDGGKGWDLTGWYGRNERDRPRWDGGKGWGLFGWHGWNGRDLLRSWWHRVGGSRWRRRKTVQRHGRQLIRIALELHTTPAVCPLRGR